MIQNIIQVCAQTQPPQKALLDYPLHILSKNLKEFFAPFSSLSIPYLALLFFQNTYLYLKLSYLFVISSNEK